MRERRAGAHKDRLGIEPGDHPLHRQRLIHRPGKYRNRIDRAAGRHHADAQTRCQRVGFNPTMLPNAAGTRPDPAVSVPSANGTIPAATAQPEPDDDPPGTSAASNTLRGTPYGLRVPTRPVAN